MTNKSKFNWLLAILLIVLMGCGNNHSSNNEPAALEIINDSNGVTFLNVINTGNIQNIRINNTEIAAFTKFVPNAIRDTDNTFTITIIGAANQIANKDGNFTRNSLKIINLASLPSLTQPNARVPARIEIVNSSHLSNQIISHELLINPTIDNNIWIEFKIVR
ncbi:MAG: hypothetical protein FWE37_08380 [Spirochaetaceae bacterium]|nr:hypothetical protein [Spirochaetaceae bacterium]